MREFMSKRIRKELTAKIPRLKGSFREYMSWPLFLAPLLIAMNLIIYFVDMKAGTIMTVFIMIYITAAIGIYQYYRKQLHCDLMNYASNYAQLQKRLLDSMTVPYAMADNAGRIAWSNKEFQKIIEQDGRGHRTLNAIFPEITGKSYPRGNEDSTVHVVFCGRNYQLSIRKILFSDVKDMISIRDQELIKVSMYAVYLFDETEVLYYQKEIEKERMVSGLIYMDNYEEALKSVEEVRRSLLVALIDRKINKYVIRYDGILKKLEKDKYFVVFKQKHLEEMKEERFSLLEDVKTVNIGNEMSITLSIGLGAGGESYIRNSDYARSAMDMALGRGGDQVVLKEKDNITYYGGKSPTQEKNTRVRARVKAHALRELIETKEDVIIMGHHISDVDCIGAAIGIYRAAKTSAKHASIVAEDVTNNVKPLMDRYRNTPEYDEDLFITKEEALKRIHPNTLLVVVDTNRPNYTESPELLSRAQNIVVLDHHRQTRDVIENALLSYVEPYASSTCEMVAEILQYYSEDIRIKSGDADAIYAGMVVDTNNFLNKTGVRTFEAAAFLRRNGADVTRVRKMFRDNMEDYKAKAEAIRNTEVFADSYAISMCPNDTNESPTVIAAQTANELLGIRGIKASFVLTDYNNQIYISGRSIDEVNVQVIMERLGGGGHLSMAGAQLKGVTMEEAIARLKDVITESIRLK